MITKDSKLMISGDLEETEFGLVKGIPIILHLGNYSCGFGACAEGSRIYEFAEISNSKLLFVNHCCKKPEGYKEVNLNFDCLGDDLGDLSQRDGWISHKGLYIPFSLGGIHCGEEDEFGINYHPLNGYKDPTSIRELYDLLDSIYKRADPANWIAPKSHHRTMKILEELL